MRDRCTYLNRLPACSHASTKGTNAHYPCLWGPTTDARVSGPQPSRRGIGCAHFATEGHRDQAIGGMLRALLFPARAWFLAHFNCLLSFVTNLGHAYCFLWRSKRVWPFLTNSRLVSPQAPAAVQPLPVDKPGEWYPHLDRPFLTRPGCIERVLICSYSAVHEYGLGEQRVPTRATLLTALSSIASPRTSGCRRRPGGSTTRRRKSSGRSGRRSESRSRRPKKSVFLCHAELISLS